MLETLDAEICPECAGRLVEAVLVEEPLLRAGGYGAARRTRRRACPECYWGVTCEVTEVAAADAGRLP